MNIKTKKIIKIFIILGFMIFLIWGWAWIHSVTFLYEHNWNLKIIEPRKKKRIFCSGINDPTIFEILYYDENDLEKIIALNGFNTINKLFVENKLNNDYNQFLNSKNLKQLEDNFNFEILDNKNNYYAYFEGDSNIEFLLLVLDVEKNVIYAFEQFD